MPISRRTFVISSSLAATSWGATRFTATGGGAATDLLLKTADLFDPDLETMMALAGVPGLSRASLRRGASTKLSVTGLADAESKAVVRDDTLFEAASLSKPTVAWVALLLVDRGLLQLDAPLRDLLGGSPVPGDARGDRITLRHVLSHSSGLQNWRFRAEDTLRLAFDPGTRFQYSGEGFVLVQRAIEKVTGTAFARVMRRELFDPLGMTDATFLWHEGIGGRLARPHGSRGEPGTSFAARGGKALAAWAAAQTPPREAASLTYPELEAAQGTIAPGQPAFPNFMLPNAAASLLITPGDYARFVALLIDDAGAPAAVRLSPATRQAMRTPQVRVAPTLSWGLGIGIEEQGGGNLLWHWGDNGGTKNFVVIDPTRGRGDIVFTNGSGGLKVVERLLRPDYGTLASFIWV